MEVGGHKQAITLGKWCEKHFTGNDSLQDLRFEELAAIGGNEGFLKIFEVFYERLFDDPGMLTLFNESKEERPAKEHGRLLGGFLLNHVTRSNDSTYYDLRMEGKGHGLGNAHYRARMCPSRKGDKGKGFLLSQGYAWLGHMHLAIDETLKTVEGDSKHQEKAKKKLMTTLVGTVFDFYGPWVMDV